MPPEIDREPIVDQQIWRGWVQRGKRREDAITRRTRRIGILLILAALGSSLYLLTKGAL